MGVDSTDPERFEHPPLVDDQPEALDDFVADIEEAVGNNKPELETGGAVEAEEIHGGQADAVRTRAGSLAAEAAVDVESAEPDSADTLSKTRLSAGKRSKNEKTATVHENAEEDAEPAKVVETNDAAGYKMPVDSTETNPEKDGEYPNYSESSADSQTVSSQQKMTGTPESNAETSQERADGKDAPKDADTIHEGDLIETGLEQDQAGEYFELYSRLAARLAGPDGHAKLTCLEVVDEATGETAERSVDIIAQHGSNPLQYPDTIQVNFTRQSESEDNDTGTRDDWILFRNEAFGNITVITSEDVARAEKNGDGTYTMPEPTADPVALAAAFDRIEPFAIEHFADELPTDEPAEYPPADRTDEQWFEEVTATFDQFERKDCIGIDIDPERIGLDPEAYSVIVSKIGVDTGDTESVDLETLTVDIIGAEGGIDDIITVFVNRRSGDGSVSAFYTNPSRSEALVEFGVEAKTENGVPGFMPPESALRMLGGMFGTENLLLPAVEAALESEEAMLNTENPVQPFPTSRDWQAWPDYKSELFDVSSDYLQESETMEPSATGSGGPAPVIEAHATAESPDNTELKQVGLDPEFVNQQTSLLQVTGSLVGDLFVRFRNRVEEHIMPSGRDTRIIRTLTLLTTEAARIDAIQVETVGSKKVQHFVRTALSKNTVALLERAHERQNLRATAGTIGFGALVRAVQGLKDGREAKIVRKFESRNISYSIMRARQSFEWAARQAGTRQRQRELLAAKNRLRRSPPSRDYVRQYHAAFMNSWGVQAAKQLAAAGMRPVSNQYGVVVAFFNNLPNRIANAQSSGGTTSGGSSKPATVAPAEKSSSGASAVPPSRRITLRPPLPRHLRLPGMHRGGASGTGNGQNGGQGILDENDYFINRILNRLLKAADENNDEAKLGE